MSIPSRSLLSLLCVFLSTAAVEAGVTCFVANSGSDSADGGTAETAWRTLAAVNSAPPGPGDRLLFRRGDVWRGQLRPRSGNPDGHVAY